MRWRGGQRSENVEDRRGRGKAVAVAGVPIGCGTVVLAVAFLALGGDPKVVLGVLEAQQEMQASTPRTQGPAAGRDDEIKDFVSVVLGDTEQVWGSIFRAAGSRYPPPTLVLFEGEVRSACGYTSAAVGPFYCPGDQKVYIDLSFYDELARRFGAPGDFAQAYVLAHEVGHHVQNLQGTMTQVHQQQQRLSKVQANQLSVRLELQADCYAGIWAHHAQTQRQLLEAGDVEEGLRAATAIGDDTLQKRARGRVQPESFTHGSSQQRVEWFSRGLRSGKLSDCDTFR